MVVAFAPIVGLLLGLSAITVPWETLILSVVLYIVVPVDRRADRPPPVLDALAALTRARRLARELAAAVARRAAGDPGAAVRLPGRADHRAAADHRHAGGADPDPGLFQRGPRLSPEPGDRRSALRRRPVGPDRRQQFLRTGRRRRHQPVRLPFGRGARDSGRRPDRGAR